LIRLKKFAWARERWRLAVRFGVKTRGTKAMQPGNETTRLIGKVLREHLTPSQRLPPDLQALLFRLALLDAERRHYGAGRARTAA
jgi:hypothetical protein